MLSIFQPLRIIFLVRLLPMVTSFFVFVPFFFFGYLSSESICLPCHVRSEYSNCLAGGVTLSEKARLRLPFPLIALAYYQKKHVCV